MSELELYCHRVASVVGLLSIEIFGYQNPACRDYAIYLGKALQFTNILRDVETDAARGRIYLPQAELKKFNVSEAEILDSKYSDRYFALAAQRRRHAQKIFISSRKKPCRRRPQINGRRRIDGQRLLAAIEKTQANQFNVFGGQPVRIGKPQSWPDFSRVAAAGLQFPDAQLRLAVIQRQRREKKIAHGFNRGFVVQEQFKPRRGGRKFPRERLCRPFGTWLVLDFFTRS